jgi:hypothetical protein
MVRQTGEKASLEKRMTRGFEENRRFRRRRDSEARSDDASATMTQRARMSTLSPLVSYGKQRVGIGHGAVGEEVEATEGGKVEVPEGDFQVGKVVDGILCKESGGSGRQSEGGESWHRDGMTEGWGDQFSER